MSATEEPGAVATTPASRLAGYLRGGGIIVPLFTTLIAFLVGGLVMLVTGSDPIATYEAIWLGTGLQWPYQWITGQDTTLAASNLQQTLILTTPLILTGLAVAFAFRAGLFNIGGQGQYLVGSFAAVYVGSSLDGTPALLHVVLSCLAACAIGGIWAGIAGLLKATTGTNEVLSTIMLNWTAVFLGAYLFGLRCRTPTRRSSRSRSPTTCSRARGCRCSGAIRSCRGCTSASSSRSPWRRCSGCC